MDEKELRCAKRAAAAGRQKEESSAEALAQEPAHGNTALQPSSFPFTVLYSLGTHLLNKIRLKGKRVSSFLLFSILQFC